MTLATPVIGERIERAEARDKVTGRALYPADLRLPGMLHAKLLRSPHAHARIRAIRVERALALPGVRCVLTAADIPNLEREPATRARAVLALDRVRFQGQPVAAVAADDVHTAEEALELIEVDYEVLPAAIDPREAMRDGAPLVRAGTVTMENAEAQAHATIATGEIHEGGDRPTNIATRVHFRRGDVAAGFAAADVVIEKTYRVGHVHQGYLEPRAAIAHWDRPDHLTVYVSAQGQFFLRSELAAILGLAESQVTVVPLEIGGGFGAKIQPIIEPITALLARKTGRPVKLVQTRREELIAATPAPETIIELKTGARRDGRLTALQARVIMDSGCFPGGPLNVACLLIGGLYRFENLEIEGIEVLTHKPSQAAYRAPGAPHGTFAIESQMDALARALGLDRMEFRLRNCSEAGDPMPNGQPWPPNGMRRVLEVMADHPIWKEHRPAPGRGIGCAVGGWLGGIQPASATVRMNPDGSFTVITGAVDLTGTNTAFRQIAAEVLGVPAAAVTVRTADSDSAPYAGMSAGSKIVYTVGSAVKAAAEDARRQILEIASRELEAAPGDLEIANGRVSVRGAPERYVTLARIGQESTRFGGRYEPVFGRGSITVTHQSPGFSGQIAEVAVDPETGRVTILRYVCVQDVGKAINPTLVEGQMQGGSAQGIGIALSEELVYDAEGRLQNPSLLDYRLMTAIDLPPIETVIVEVPSPYGPFGAKGAGEPPIVPGPAALANAIRDAIGCDLTDLPMTPEKIVAALQSQPSTAPRPI
ncbi:MAG: xanthine dehydrogenase family protein molybdopterin-binding subunit [Chloroflexi bacterium]|nr:xanthine dehydrogenase family protein molybdopterin-binding subunit [Chloroflexota bacterium]